MTATANGLLAVARSQIGYVEAGGPDGRSGNLTKYWAELDPTFQGQPWCATFVRWVQRHAGAPLLPVALPYYCPSIVTYARQHGLWDTSGHYAPGDLVFWSWAVDGVAEHIEIVEADNGVQLTDIGGNTSPGEAGSQSNGGGVYQRLRLHGAQLMGVLKYSRFLAVPNTAPAVPVPPPRNPVKLNPFPAPVGAVVRLGLGMPPEGPSNAVRYVQWAVGVPVDGRFGPQTEGAVRLFQAHHFCTVDGIVGPQTLTQLRYVTH